MTPITPHFFLEEFACHDGTQYPEEWIEARLRPLCETLEVIREAVSARVGREVPIRIDSGYRTIAWDTRIWQKSQAEGGGENDKASPKTSQHPKGRAADIRCGPLTAVELRDLIGDLYRAGRLPHLGGLGVYPSFVHVDVRPRPGSVGGACDGHLAQWGGSRLSNIP